MSARVKSAFRPQHRVTLDWRNRVIQAGGTIAADILAAHDDFAYALDAAGLLPKIYRLNTFSGDSFTSALVPFIRTVGYSADRNTAFVSGDWSQANGLKGDGSTKSLSTGIQDIWLIYSDLTLFFYGKTYEQTATTNLGIGVLNATTAPQLWLSVRRALATAVPSFVAAATGSSNKELGFGISRSQGFIGGTATSLGPLKTFFQGNLENQQNAGLNRTAPTTSVARDLFVFANNAGTANSHTASHGWGYGIMLGVTDDQMWDLHRALYNLFIALGRETAVNALSFWGDSQSILSRLPGSMYAVGPANRGVFTSGTDGEDSSEIRIKFFLDTRHHGTDQVSIFWTGHHNSDYENPALCMANLAAMINSLPSDKFIVLTPVNDSTLTIGTTGYNQTITLISQMLAAYPDNIIDVRAYLLTQGDGGGTDNADIANGVVPTSLRSDTQHLNTAGNDLVAAQIQAFLTGKGW